MLEIRARSRLGDYRIVGRRKLDCYPRIEPAVNIEVARSAYEIYILRAVEVLGLGAVGVFRPVRVELADLVTDVKIRVLIRKVCDEYGAGREHMPSPDADIISLFLVFEPGE